MKINNNQISKIIEDCKMSGYTIKVRDISYILLSNIYEDETLAYKVVFGSDFDDDDVNQYNKSKAISFLRRYINSNYSESVSNKSKKGKNKDITFEDNKAAMIELIEQTEKDYNDGLIEAKDRLKIVSELRVKLNDKFKVQEDVKEQIVVVNMKYNSVCACGRECYVPTKEDLMKQYNLIEKNTNQDG